MRTCMPLPPNPQLSSQKKKKTYIRMHDSNPFFQDDEVSVQEAQHLTSKQTLLLLLSPQHTTHNSAHNSAQAKAGGGSWTILV